MKNLLYRTIKMSAGFTIGAAIGMQLGLDFPVSAGIIAILNLLETKKATVRVAWRRLYSSLLGLLLAVLIFRLFGYTTLNLGIFLLLFIPLAIKVSAKEGIIVNTVLASHLLTYRDVTLQVLVNELSLVLIGGLVALTLNLHVPDREKALKDAQQSVEEKIRALLWTMSFNMRNLCTIHSEEPNLRELEKEIKSAKKLAYEYMNNYFLEDNSYYLEYFQMRLLQLYRLFYMKEHLDMVFVDQEQAMTLSRFTGRMAYEYEEGNDGRSLLNRLDDIREEFRTTDLPTSRMEFENRAALFQYLNDLEEFIKLKLRFYQRQFEQEEKKR